MKFFNLILVIIIAMPCFGQSLDLNKLRLPDGFSISVYAEVENPRQLTLGDENTVYVGSLRGKVWPNLAPKATNINGIFIAQR